MSSYDTDVSHYSIPELLDLIGLSRIEHIAEHEFSAIIDGLVNKYRSVDETLSRFFADVGQRLYSLLVRDDDDDDDVGSEGSAEGMDGGGDEGMEDGGGEGMEDGGGGGGVMREGLAMRSQTARGGNNTKKSDSDPLGELEGGEVASGGDPNDIMGLRRDINKGVVSADQQLKWERMQYLDDSGDEGAAGGAGGAGERREMGCM